MLSWNLMHGRALPPAGHDLFSEFAAALARWDWDVALLQEVPPWWPAQLADRLRSEQRYVLTSRNAFLPLRRAIATRWPDLIKSNGGGANAILVRRTRIDEHRMQLLRTFPERRWLHAVRLGSPQVWIGNLHAGGSQREASRAASAILAWASSSPLLLGGDFNLPEPSVPGLELLGGRASDHFLARGIQIAAPVQVLDRGRCSDHAPLLVRTGTP